MKLANLFEVEKNPLLTNPNINAERDLTDTILPFLMSHCKGAIEGYKQAGKFLYRGVKTVPTDEFIAPILQDRYPVIGSSKEVHKIANEAMKKLGAVAHRGNSIFCTTNTNEPGNWGSGVIVFPFDPFDVTWFANQTGAYMHHEIYNLAGEDEFKDAEEAKQIVMMADHLANFDMKTGKGADGLAAAILSGVPETLISGSKYVGLDMYKYKQILGKHIMGWGRASDET